jgi:hypothetical protein
VTEYGATDAIATSTGQNDSGLFELSFRDERYLPFEFAGAVSRWRIELPRETNYLPRETITDCVFNLNVTAREGGEPLRRAAMREAQRHLPGGGIRLFDVRQDLPEAWARVTRPAPDAQQAVLPIRLGREHFPYLPGDPAVQVYRIDVFATFDGPDRRESRLLRFVLEHEADHGDDQECRCEGRTVRCVATTDCPAIYHGAIEAELPPLDRGRVRDLGELRFPRTDDRLTGLFIACGYRAVR